MIQKYVCSGLLLLTTILSAAHSASFSYNAQNQWPGICVTGNTGRQSPINIQSDAVFTLQNLTALSFSLEYDSAIRGEFANTGHSVKFTPESTVNAVMGTPFGDYEFLQFHFHWGNKSGSGSEHLEDGVADEFEVHFVHKKVNLTDPLAGDALAVLGVRGQLAESQATAGVFKELNTTQIRKNHTKTVVNNIVMSDLLPRDRDYYYYEGSLTTPNCTEIVQWYVLKDQIKVSGEYMKDLRLVVMDDKGTYNYRDTQPLNNRTVYTFNVRCFNVCIP